MINTILDRLRMLTDGRNRMIIHVVLIVVMIVLMFLYLLDVDFTSAPEYIYNNF